jgi:Flp pilus assembly protein TadD
MPSFRSSNSCRNRRAGAFLASAAALVLAGCAQSALPELETSALTAPASSEPPATGTAGTGVIEQARALRAKGEKAKALALLDAAARQAPNDKVLAKERGLLALELGHIATAEPLLKNAVDPAAPDWRVHSALGSAMAASGRPKEAQKQFSKALELAPDHPSVLNNLALAYALDGKHEEAERLLRQVAARSDAAPKAKQNLALLRDLKGKGEPGRLAAANEPPAAREKSSLSPAADSPGLEPVAAAQARAFAPAN